MVVAALRSEVGVEGVKRRVDTIDVASVNEVVAIVSYEAAPVVFFAKNSTLPLSSTTQLGMYQQSVLKALRQYAIEHPEARITVIGSSSADEEPSLAKERLSWTINELGIDASRLTMRTEQQGDVPYPELAAEHRSVSFLVNNKSIVILIVQRDTTRTSIDVVIPVSHIITCEAGPCDSELRVRFVGMDIKVQGIGPVYSVVLPQSGLLNVGRTETLEVQGLVTDTTGRLATSATTVMIAPQVRSRSEVRTTVGAEQIGGDPLVLGHFSFDASTFLTTNPDAIAAVRDAIAAGKKVTLIPSADNLGTELYNEQLLQRRARAAIELLGVRDQDVSVSAVVTTAASNETPMGRTANRSVRAIIQ